MVQHPKAFPLSWLNGEGLAYEEKEDGQEKQTCRVNGHISSLRVVIGRNGDGSLRNVKKYSNVANKTQAGDNERSKAGGVSSTVDAPQFPEQGLNGVREVVACRSKNCCIRVCG